MKMEIIYFTFGTDPKFPYGIDDYVIVIGSSRKDCIETFKKKYPGKPEHVINCSDYYTTSQWNKSTGRHYNGRRPAELLISDTAYGIKPAGFDPLWFFVPGKNSLIYLRADSEDGMNYLDCTCYHLEGSDISENGGNQVPLVCNIHKGYDCLADSIPDVLTHIYDDMFIEVQILKTGE